MCNIHRIDQVVMDLTSLSPRSFRKDSFPHTLSKALFNLSYSLIVVRSSRLHVSVVLACHKAPLTG
jgi:hypothetical protein